MRKKQAGAEKTEQLKSQLMTDEALNGKLNMNKSKK